MYALLQTQLPVNCMSYQNFMFVATHASLGKGVSVSTEHSIDNVSERLRRLIRNQLGFACVGSSPAVVVNLLF
jgi:hypothetical protein